MSSRVKKCLEPTVEKYIEFLKSVRRGSGLSGQSLKIMILSYGINKTVKKALVDLAIIDYEANNKWTWLSFEPDRVLALTVLNYLLERSKKSRATVIAGLEDTNSLIKALNEKLGELVHQNKSGLRTPQIASNGNLFSQQDTKSDLINKAAFAISGGMYQDNASSTNVKEPFNIWNDEHVHYQNERIVFAAKDLVNQLLK